MAESGPARLHAVGAVHETASLLSFIDGSVAAIFGFRFPKAPRSFSLVLGVIALLATYVVTFQGRFIRWNDVLGLGLGGIATTSVAGGAGR